MQWRSTYRRTTSILRQFEMYFTDEQKRGQVTMLKYFFLDDLAELLSAKQTKTMILHNSLHGCLLRTLLLYTFFMSQF